ncbi:zf-TFIIB domain-containing protein [Kribbella solani]|uniref:TFIIB-type zinc ribbon-containing protein n=1 Tax=Kribbella solani TaxID=236067 RepID=UPI0029A1448B|nr:zf-TFIIB domain-containing protein [Kribbella solani]MDX3003993.1 zf-TFIIB domain-containing protein [Kribbella solani]
MESLTCPKCRGLMRTYERSGVTVDQCGDCRGIFLDRGELEHLVDAELRHNAPKQHDDRRGDDRRYGERRGDDRRYDDRKYDDRKYDNHGYGNQQYQQKKRKKSFLDDLFD